MQLKYFMTQLVRKTNVQTWSYKNDYVECLPQT